MCNCRYERIEIPLHIVPSTSIGQACLESLVELPRIFSQEEEEAYQSLARKPNMDLITKLHNASGKFLFWLPILIDLKDIYICIIIVVTFAYVFNLLNVS